MTKLTRRRLIALAAASTAALAADATAVIGKDKPVTKTGEMPKRKLGKTGEMVSILAFGGYHLCEVIPSEAEKLLNYYLDAGGNFIETAVSYGDSEEKIGQVMKRRRGECFLSTKTHHRTKDEAAKSIDTSLKRLQTDHVDNLFIHNVHTEADLNAVLSPNGALAAAEAARSAGKVRYISVTSHSPEMLQKALKAYRFDAVMEWMNYYDYFNFPLIYDEIIPYCSERGIGLIAMKPIADGLLYRNPERAMRWAWSLPIASVAAGNNSMQMLETNIRLAKSFKPMSKDEKSDLYKTAPEYANYVCRRCDKCLSNTLGLDIKEIFAIEGYYDRQMYTGDVPDPVEYALREKLKFWFGNQDAAKERYAKLSPKVPKDLNPNAIQGKCPYGINVPRKLRIAAWKLTGDAEYLAGA